MTEVLQQKAESLEDSAIAKAIAILDEHECVTSLEVSIQDFRHVADASSDLRCVEHVDNCSSFVRILKPNLRVPSSREPPVQMLRLRVQD